MRARLSTLVIATATGSPEITVNTSPLVPAEITMDSPERKSFRIQDAVLDLISSLEPLACVIVPQQVRTQSGQYVVSAPSGTRLVTATWTRNPIRVPGATPPAADAESFTGVLVMSHSSPHRQAETLNLTILKVTNLRLVPFPAGG
jgi:hypothetical protein